MFSTKYMEETLFYLPWKTKFIERFCIPYAKFKKDITESRVTKEQVVAYFSLYRTMLDILQKKLSSDYQLKFKLYPEIIKYAKEYDLIKDESLCYEVLDFLYRFQDDKTLYRDFKKEYIALMEDFSKAFKVFTKVSGFREKDYVIYDNSYCNWGLSEDFYNFILNFFYQKEKIKIVKIFGSRVTQNYHDFSDIDMICEGTYSMLEFSQIKKELQELEIPFTIDIYDVNWENKPFIYRNIIRSNLFYQRCDYADDDYVSIFT